MLGKYIYILNFIPCIEVGGLNYSTCIGEQINFMTTVWKFCEIILLMINKLLVDKSG
jgi:hypothetical protein